MPAQDAAAFKKRAHGARTSKRATPKRRCGRARTQRRLHMTTHARHRPRCRGWRRSRCEVRTPRRRRNVGMSDKRRPRRASQRTTCTARKRHGPRPVRCERRCERRCVRQSVRQDGRGGMQRCVRRRMWWRMWGTAVATHLARAWCCWCYWSGYHEWHTRMRRMHRRRRHHQRTRREDVSRTNTDHPD